MKSLYGMTLVLLANAALAQPAANGTATNVSNADIQAAVKATASMPVNDTQLRVVPVNGEYNVGVAVVHRSKASTSAGGAVAHSTVSEIYQIVSGNGTLLTGGTLANPMPETAGGLGGPSRNGSSIMNGQSRNVGPGDIIVIPAGTPHTFSAIASDEIVYTVVRVDPRKVLPVK